MSNSTVTNPFERDLKEDYMWRTHAYTFSRAFLPYICVPLPMFDYTLPYESLRKVRAFGDSQGDPLWTYVLSVIHTEGVEETELVSGTVQVDLQRGEDEHTYIFTASDGKQWRAVVEDHLGDEGLYETTRKVTGPSGNGVTFEEMCELIFKLGGPRLRNSYPTLISNTVSEGMFERYLSDTSRLNAPMILEHDLTGLVDFSHAETDDTWKMFLKALVDADVVSGEWVYLKPHAVSEAGPRTCAAKARLVQLEGFSVLEMKIPRTPARHAWLSPQAGVDYAQSKEELPRGVPLQFIHLGDSFSSALKSGDIIAGANVPFEAQTTVPEGWTVRSWLECLFFVGAVLSPV